MSDALAGLAIASAADSAYRGRDPDEPAIVILDRICEPYRGRAPDFRAVDPDHPDRPHPRLMSYCDPYPEAGLGMLMIEAFAPDCMRDPEEHRRSPESHWRAVVRKFYTRYRFDPYVAVACYSCGLSADGIGRLDRDPLSRAFRDVAAAARHNAAEDGRSGCDLRDHGDLTRAGALLALNAAATDEDRARHPYKWPPESWPLSRASWKPTDRRDDLVQACALLIQAIVKIDGATTTQR